MPRLHDTTLIAAIGRRLRAVREGAGLTQEKLAELIDVDPVTLSRAEGGSRALSVSNLARAAEALQIPLAAIFAFDDPIPAPAVSMMAHELLARVARLSAPHQQVVVRLAAELERAEAAALQGREEHREPRPGDEDHVDAADPLAG